MTEARGLCLCSTASLYTLADVQLWLRRTTHQGALTKHLSLSTVAEPLASKERCTRPRTFYLTAASLSELTECSVGKVPRRRTVSLFQRRVPKPTGIYSPRGGENWKGRYLVIGFAAGAIPRIPLNLPLLKVCSIVGVFWGAFAEREPQHNAGNLRPHISATYPLEQAADALYEMLNRRVQGKVVLVP